MHMPLLLSVSALLVGDGRQASMMMPTNPQPQDSLVKIAKKLKKNNVAVDIVSFGSEVRQRGWTGRNG